MSATIFIASAFTAVGLAAAQTLEISNPQPAGFWYCTVEAIGFSARGGGMAGDGWDGPGQGVVVVTYHIETTSSDLPVLDQRATVTAALTTWASVVQIDFVEIAQPNRNRSIDLRFEFGNHCDIEPAECGDSDCPFDGLGGVIAHAGFPPGVSSQCIDPMPESWAGNVHFDDAEVWELDNVNLNQGELSMALVAAHEIGHSIGLTHDTGPGGPHIMGPSVNDVMGLFNPSGSDIAQVQSGYLAGVGSVLSFEVGGLWVNSAYEGPELGLAGDPIHTITGAVAALPTQTTGITMHVLGGLYPGPVTIDKPCTITSEFSTAFIGQ
jgi:matrixin